MKILAIDTSCDETSASVTDELTVLSNIIWSQASLHAKWGGILPSLAQREHAKRIDWVISSAIKKAKIKMQDLDLIAVTAGPGLSIALEVGIKKAKELAGRFDKPLVAVNHVEGHLLSPLAKAKSSKSQSSNENINSLSMGLVVSGGTTQIILIKEIGKYEILATTIDDALGEALDKGARLLGLGYPGGAILEKMAEKGIPKTYPLPLPFQGQKNEERFSYSGLKTALVRLVEKIKANNYLTKQEIFDLAASYQDIAFEHLTKVARYEIGKHPEVKDLFVGGGVAANNELRKRLRKLGKEFDLRVHFPYTKKLCGDNAAMIGIAAYFKSQRGEVLNASKINTLDREPRAKIDQKFFWEIN